MEPIHYFSQESDNYLAYRPVYPDVLFDFLKRLVGKQAVVWDCGTGNGQYAVALGKRFERVVATDLHWSQLSLAAPKNNVHYLACPAELSPFKDNSFDLITVAQALYLRYLRCQR